MSRRGSLGSVYKNLFFDAERLEVLNLVVAPLLRLTHDVLWEYLILPSCMLCTVNAVSTPDSMSTACSSL